VSSSFPGPVHGGCCGTSAKPGTAVTPPVPAPIAPAPVPAFMRHLHSWKVSLQHDDMHMHELPKLFNVTGWQHVCHVLHLQRRWSLACLIWTSMYWMLIAHADICTRSLAGYTTGELGSCSNCPSNTFKESDGNTACTPCPSNSLSQEGSSTKQSCTCKVGFTGPSGGPCVPFSSSPPSPPGQGETDTDTITVSDDAPSPPPATTVTTHVVKLSLSLPMIKEQFDDEKQAKFKESIAKSAGASPADVSIDQVEAISSDRRRLLASGVRIDVSVQAEDKASADAMVAGLTIGNINAELSKTGLPRAEVLVEPSTAAVSTGPATAVSGSSSVEGGGGMAPIIIGGVVGGVVLIGISVVWWWCRRKKKKSGVSVRVERARARARAVKCVHVSAYMKRVMTCARKCTQKYRTQPYLRLHTQISKVSMTPWIRLVGSPRKSLSTRPPKQLSAPQSRRTSLPL